MQRLASRILIVVGVFVLVIAVVLIARTRAVRVDSMDANPTKADLSIKEIQLEDYKVRIVNSKDGTAAKVRVVIEFRDKNSLWATVGVSTNVIEASWRAMIDAYEYKLLKDRVS